MRKTAAELLAELEGNPAWVAARDERERELAVRQREFARLEAPLVSALRGAGFDIDSVWDLVNNSPHPFLQRRFVGDYSKAYPILVEHLGRPYDPKIREGIIRALTVRDGGQSVEHALFAAFQAEVELTARWVLANALKVAMPYQRRRKHPEIAAALRIGGA
jgi:hypothetical protein